MSHSFSNRRSRSKHRHRRDDRHGHWRSQGVPPELDGRRSEGGRPRDFRRGTQPQQPVPNEYVRRPGRIENLNGTLTITRDRWSMFPPPGEPLFIAIGNVEFESEIRSFMDRDERSGAQREIRELDLDFMGGNIGFAKGKTIKLVKQEDEVHGYVYVMTLIRDEEEGEGEGAAEAGKEGQAAQDGAAGQAGAAPAQPAPQQPGAPRPAPGGGGQAGNR